MTRRKISIKREQRELAHIAERERFIQNPDLVRAMPIRLAPYPLSRALAVMTIPDFYHRVNY